MGPRFPPVYYNTRPYVAGAYQQFLDDEGVDALDWPTISSDLNPVEHLWDIMYLSIHHCQVASVQVIHTAEPLMAFHRWVSLLCNFSTFIRVQC